MKLFISADIEGTCGIADWRETELGESAGEPFRRQMSREVAAVCLGAQDVGWEEIVVKDAHDTARNLQPELLPETAQVLRGWTQDPYGMLSGLDSSFDACAFTGYHSAGSTGGSPLAHTMSTSLFSVTLNGKIAGEFLLNAYAAEYFGVPVVLVTGDEALCASAEKLIPAIVTVPVCRGIGGGMLSVHPDRAVDLIREGAQRALERDVSECRLTLPDAFELEVIYKRQHEAYRNSFFPGARLVNDCTVAFEADNYFDVLTFIHFCM